MRKAIAVILTIIVLSLCIFAGCGPQKTGENVMPEEDFNIYKNGKLKMTAEDIGMNTGRGISEIKGEETYRRLKEGDPIELVEALYGNEIVYYEDENGKMKEYKVKDYLEENKDNVGEEYIHLNMYRIYYNEKIYNKKEISEIPEDDSKFITYKCLTIHTDGKKVAAIDLSHGRKPLGFKLA